MINATVLTLGTGIVGMMCQKWISEYFEDNHYYKTRYLDADGVPSEPDVGWMADASGKWGPIIVTRYVMGGRKKNRTVEFKHIINGKGRPRKLSIKAFRAAVVARPDEELTPDEIRMLEQHGVVIDPPDESPMLMNYSVGHFDKIEKSEMTELYARIDKVTNSFTLHAEIINDMLQMNQELHSKNASKDILRDNIINALENVAELSKEFAEFKQARPVKGSTILTKVMEKVEPLDKRIGECENLTFVFEQEIDGLRNHIANLEKTNEG